jgi:PEP-CTERM motif
MFGFPIAGCRCSVLEMHHQVKWKVRKGGFMSRVRVYVLAIAAGCFLLLSPGDARADSLTGSVGITWLYPNTSTTAYASDTIGVGSSLTCPGASPICAGYAGAGTQTFSVGSSAISYTASGTSFGYHPGTFNGFDFTGLTFTSGSLTGFNLTTNIAGLSNSNVTFGPSFIEINLAALPVNGYFTLDLNPGSKTTVPEPSSLVLLGTGLLSLIGFMRRKAMA